MPSANVRYPPADHPFHKHSDNLRSVLKGLTQAERVHKEMIRQGNGEAIEHLRRMHGLVIGMVAEARLRKVMSDPDGFNDRERSLIARTTSQHGRWVQAVDLAFRRQYGIAIHQEIDQHSADLTVVTRHTTMVSLLDNDLRPIIEDRNKVAHGQWVWLLNSKETDFTGRAASPLNYKALRSRSQLIRYLSEIVHALVVSEPTFQRDFDAIYGRLQVSKTALDGSDYPQFATLLRQQGLDRITRIQAQGAGAGSTGSG